MAKVKRRKWKLADGTTGEGWEVTWKELTVTVDASGAETRKWTGRRRRVPTRKAGEALAREIETAQALGQRWEDTRAVPVVTLDALCEAYIKASYASRPENTAHFRACLLQRFLGFAGSGRPATDLTTGLLAQYAEHLRSEGIVSRSRYVGVVEQLWRWAHNKSDTYPGVPSPRTITGADGDLPHRPSPVTAVIPSWQDVDALLHALAPDGAPQGAGKGSGYRPQWALHRRVALVLRFTGLRVSQILALRWEDLDLERGSLTLRANVKGASGMGNDRVVPLHPALASEVAGWGVPEGHLFKRIVTRGKRRGQSVVPRGSEVAEVFAAAWERAGVNPDKWAGARERKKQRPTHAIRARFRSSIVDAAGNNLARLLLGQSGHSEHDAYVAMGKPEASPYWDAMVTALNAIPPVMPPANNVVPLHSASHQAL